MAAGLPKLKCLSVFFVFLMIALAITVVPTHAQDTQTDSQEFDDGIVVEDVQSSSETFTPPGIINVIRNTVQAETQSDSASVDDVLIPTVESAVADGVPPGNIVSLIKHLDKLGLSADEMAEAVERLNELIDSGMPPGQALNQVKAEMEAGDENEAPDEEGGDEADTTASSSSSNGNGNGRGNGNGNNDNNGNGNGNGNAGGNGNNGNGNNGDKGKGKGKK